jgi:hypothetical protein
MKRNSLSLLFIILTLFIAACGTSSPEAEVETAVPEPAATSTTEPTAEPTAEPTVEPTVEPTAVPPTPEPTNTPEPEVVIDPSRIETFTFASGDTSLNGKIFLPTAYDTNKDLPVVFLTDFTETAVDEFEQIIDGVQRQGIDALVVTLESIPRGQALASSYQKHYEIYKDMASYVESNYTSNTSRTFIGRGSAAGVVLMTLFLEDAETALFNNFIATDPSASYAYSIIDMLENEGVSQNQLNKKLHFSFSRSNDRAAVTKLIDLITEAQYPWLDFESREYATGWSDTYPSAYADGIEFAFTE